MKKTARRILAGIGIILLAALLAGGGFAIYLYLQASHVVEEAGRDVFSENESTYLYRADGEVLARLNTGEDRVYLPYKDIPEDVVHAFIAVEDRRFYSHFGVDIIGILRSAAVYVTSEGEELQGGSTITQQLARTVFLSNEVTLERKVKEAFLALALEAAYSKEDILEFYINNVYFANGAYGIEAAARSYFGCPASELTLSQTALLCAIPNSPSWYDPRENLSHTLERRDKILGDMLEQGYISQEEYEEALEEEPVIREEETERTDYETTYAVDCAVRFLMEQDGFQFRYYFDSQLAYEGYMESYESVYEREREKLYRGGYEIQTSLDQEKQRLLQREIDENLEDFTETDEDGVYELQGAAALVDNATGKIVAVSGGRSQESQSANLLNRAYQSYRQPGSSIKPLLVYAPALDLGYTESSVLQEIDVSLLGEYKGRETALSGSPIRLDQALYNSKNGAACYLLAQIGVPTGLGYLENMHFHRLMYSDQNVVSALGGFTYGTNVVEMAGAYRTFANGGNYTEPTCITSIRYQGEEIYEEPVQERVYKASTAAKMLELLEGVVKYGTARRMYWDADVPAAGKTGTTNDNRDGWFCGMIPDYTLSVWVGCDTPQKVAGLSGSTYPMRIFKGVMEELAGEPVRTEFRVEEDPEEEQTFTYAEEVQDYEDYLPGRADEEELSPGYTVANYRQDHMLADTVDVLIREYNSTADASRKEELLREMNAAKEQIYGRTIKGEVEAKIAQLE